MRKPLRHLLALFCCIAAGITTAGCGDEDGGGAEDDEASTAAEIRIVEFKFDPAVVEVGPGADVVVRNDDDAGHTATAEDLFDTDTIERKATGTFTAPTAAGEYDYICSLHPFMKGTLVVE